MPITLWQDETIVNQTLNTYQDSPDITTLSNGNFVVVYDNEDGSPNHINYRVFDAFGQPVTDELVFEHNEATGNAYNPSVTALANGGFAISGSIYTVTGAKGAGIIYDAAGVEQTEFTLSGGAAANHSYINLATDAAGNIWAAFQDGFNNIIMERFNGTTGANNLAQFTINQTTAAGSSPEMVAVGDGVAVVWRDGTDTGFNVFDSTGTAQFVSDVVISGTTSSSVPHIAAAENGSFLITYTTLGGDFPGIGYDVRGVIVDSTGTVYGQPFFIAENTAGDQTRNATVALQDGNFLVAYMDNHADMIMAQLISPLGRLLGPAFMVTDSMPGMSSSSWNKIEASVTADGRVIISYNSTGNDEEDSSSDGVFFTIVDPRQGRILGDSSSETLLGGIGNDTIMARGGADTAYGYQGNDLIRGSHSSADVDTFFGMGGDDILYGYAGNDVLHGGNGNDFLGGGSGDDTLNGGAGDDELRGGAGVDTLNGGAGDDQIFGGVGNDIIHGEVGNDTLFGGDGNDIINGGIGDDAIEGGTGEDVIDGGEGNDTLYGQGDNDTIKGGKGTDGLSGGDGDDDLSGGSGNDTLFGDTDNDTLNGGTGNDYMVGGSGNDTLIGGTGADALFGDNDTDFLNGGKGDDTLYGGAGTDTLKGGEGNDVLNGGAGNDILTGGANADRFEFYSGMGMDTVTDFTNNSDTIHLDSSLNLGGLAAMSIADILLIYGNVDGSGNVILDFGYGDVITFEGLTNINWLSNDIDLMAI